MEASLDADESSVRLADIDRLRCFTYLLSPELLKRWDALVVAAVASIEDAAGASISNAKKRACPRDAKGHKKVKTDDTSVLRFF